MYTYVFFTFVNFVFYDIAGEPDRKNYLAFCLQGFISQRNERSPFQNSIPLLPPRALLETSPNPLQELVGDFCLQVNLSGPRLLTGAFLVAQVVENLLKGGRPVFDPWVGKIPWRRAWQPTPVFLLGEFPWTEVLSGLKSMGSQRADMTEWLSTHT